MAATLLSGCGYSLATKNTTIPKGKSVAVKMFANRTYQPNIEGDFRRALVNELAARGLVSGNDAADFIISGEIVSLTINTAAFSAVDRAMLYTVVIGINMQLVEKNSGKSVWKGSETISQEYPANTDLALQRNALDAAVLSACTNAAELLVAKMNQSF